MRSIQILTLASALLTSCGTNGTSSTNGTNGTATAGVDIHPARENAPAPTPTPSHARPPLFAVPVEGLPQMGAKDALVTIVEFTDYDCPYCGKVEHTVHALREKYGKDVRVAVAMHPLPMHPHARDAALAALAADFSSGFESLHPRLFENPDARSAAELSALAVESGLDRTSFERAIATKAPKAALAGAEALAASLHVRGTPIFFINGRKIGGAQSLATFDAVVTEELAHAKELVSGGISRDAVYAAIIDEAHKNPAALDDDEAEDGPSFVPEARTVGGAHFLGRPDAATTIVLFTDFECPFCKRFDAELREVAEKHDDVHVVLRQRPLPMHAHARLAAKAAIAAEAQGKLDAFSKALFLHQDALDRAALESYAADVGLDRARFLRDIDSSDTEARLAADEALGTKLGVKGTPTSFVQGRRIIGAQPITTVEDAVLHPLAHD